MSNYDTSGFGVNELLQKITIQEQYINELETVLDHSLIGFCVADCKGNIVRVNKAQSRITGNEAEDEIGSNLAEQEAEGIISTSTTMRVLASGKGLSMEQSTLNGKRYFVQSSPVFDGEGNIQLVVSNLIDMKDIEKLKRDILSSTIEKDERALEDGYTRIDRIEPEKIIYKSSRMRDILAVSKKMALSDSTVMILGETGVGKELMAEFIHQNSLRKEKPFIRINCGAIPENLLEAELFGYEAGSFTGGEKIGRKGLLEFADKGTLFLDEVGEMSISLQVKMLRFLQKQEFYRVGGRKCISLDVRIIAATNADLEIQVDAGLFREDLYYRLNVLPIRIPSLSERTEDIPMLVEHFLAQFNKKYAFEKCISEKVIEEISRQKMKGNIRELQHIVERLVLISDAQLIDLDVYESIVQFCIKTSDKLSKSELDEKSLLKMLMEEHKTTKRVSEVLEISQSTAWRKLRKHQII